MGSVQRSQQNTAHVCFYYLGERDRESLNHFCERAPNRALNSLYVHCLFIGTTHACPPASPPICTCLLLHKPPRTQWYAASTVTWTTFFRRTTRLV